MSEPRDRSRLARFVRRFWWVLVLLLVAVLAASVVAIWNARHVKWAEVMAAVARQKTINGVGRIYGEDGSEWAVAVWVRVDEAHSFASNQMLVPVSARPNQQPGPEVMALASAADYPDYIVRALALLGHTARVRATTWSGKPTLETEVVFPVDRVEGEMVGGHPPYLSLIRFYLDPDTKLVMAAELLVDGKARASVEYRYNLPLPKGFRPK